MKKIIALALAATMAAGMTTVAFAATVPTAAVPQLVVGYQKNASTTGLDAGIAYTTDANGDIVKQVLANDPIAPGSKVYIPVYFSADEDTASFGVVAAADTFTEPTAAQRKGYSVHENWKIGKLESKPKLDYAKFPADPSNPAITSYQYAIVLEVPTIVEVKPLDIAGTVTLAKSSSEAKDPAKSANRTFDFKHTVERTVMGINDNFTGSFDRDTAGAWVDFDDTATDIDIEFKDDATFSVNVNGQSNLNLRYNTKYNSTVGALDTAANIDFITFEAKPAFNRTGVFTIHAEDDNMFIYEVTATGLKAIDTEYDEDMGGYTFKTRKLTAYAISDKEITNTEFETEVETPETPETSEPTESGKPNPDTGR